MTRLAIVGNFGLGYKATMAARAVPLALELSSLGYETSIFVPREAPNAPPITPLGPIHVVAAGTVGSGPRQLRALGHLWLGLSLAWQALRWRPAVLYAFKPKGYAGLALLAFWALRRLGLIDTILALDTDDWEGSGGWADLECRPVWLTGLISWHERWCLRHANVVSVASRELVRLAARERADVVYLPNATSESSPGWKAGDRARGRFRLGLDDAPIVLAYTRFFEFGPRRLVEIFERIRQRVPDARLVVVGKGLGNEDAELTTLVAERGLSGAVHQLGWTKAEDLPDLFAAADVALYPLDDTLLNRAKCPMKLVDLLLAGVPVVADRVGQAEEYVEDSQTGRLVPPGNVAAMADAAVELLRDPAAARALGERARAITPDRWSWADQAKVIAAALHRARAGAG